MTVYVLEHSQPPRVLLLSPDATLADVSAAIPQAVPVASVPARMPRGAMVVRVREGGSIGWVSMKLERNTPCC
jgi:hypothetical protein